MTNWEQLLLYALGLTTREFEMEMMRFLMSPKAWLEKRLRVLGWVKKSEIPPPAPCQQTCCLSGSGSLPRP